MFLITTADQHFWKTDEPVLFLGEWCKLFSQRSVWEKMDYEVLPYHWDDRKKLYQDYLYLDKLYEQTLFQMRELLNQIHGVDHSLRYWRIVIGPWLYYFIQILYERYQSILTAIESGKVINTLVSKYDGMMWLPRGFPCFLKWFMNDDYNHYLYGRLIEFTGRIPFDVVDVEGGNNHKEPAKSIIDHLAPKRIARRLIILCGKLIPDRFNQIVLISSYLSRFDLIKLQLSLRQIPYLFPPDVPVPEVDTDLIAREKLSFESPKSEFEALLGTMIREQIPLSYLEGYARMNERSLKAYPKNPKVIFTANAYNSNEAFKIWAAHHVDRGVKLVGTQHGGNYGTALWSSTESHEIQSDDIYYTWGWKSDIYGNTKPLAAAKLNKAKSVSPNNDGRILLVLWATRHYSSEMCSVPVAASGTLAFFNDQYRFVRALSRENQKLLLVRLHLHDYGWSQMDRWNSEFPEIECYCGSKSMLDQLKESRLAVVAYKATSYLETLAANFPSILFWNPKHWELRSSATSYFDALRQAGILHDTPESAAQKVNEICRDPETWWETSEVQNAKKNFCKQFTAGSSNWIKEWRNELLEIEKAELHKQAKHGMLRE